MIELHSWVDVAQYYEGEDMRNIVLLFPFLMIFAAGMAHKYKDDPEAPFNAFITFSWWAFGATLLLTIIVAVMSNKERPGYHSRVAQMAGMPIITLIAIGFIYLFKSTLN